MGKPFLTVTDDLPLAQIPADLAQPLRPYLDAAADEMMLEIQALVPEYARAPDSKYGRKMRSTVQETVRTFVDAIGRPDLDWDRITGIYAEIGAYEARKGRNLDGLQTAIRVSGQVACRRFIKDARRLNWSLHTLGHVTESLFVLQEKLAGAAAQGYAAAQEQLVTERERFRSRLRDLLVAEPPASREAIAELARPAGWETPLTVAIVAVRPGSRQRPPMVPPFVLADWDAEVPYMIVPDPDGPGRDRLVAGLVRGCPAAAIGPTVPLTRGAVSRRWAVRTLELVGRGVIEAPGGAPDEPVRCLDHVPTLVAAMSEELISVALAERLAPLRKLPQHRREPLARTLLAYLENKDNAVATADRVLVHEQTVRYRIRRLEEMLGDVLHEPGRRLELLLLLHAWVHFGDIRPDVVRPEAGPGTRPGRRPRAVGAASIA